MREQKECGGGISSLLVLSEKATWKGSHLCQVFMSELTGRSGSRKSLWKGTAWHSMIWVTGDWRACREAGGMRHVRQVETTFGRPCVLYSKAYM